MESVSVRPNYTFPGDPAFRSRSWARRAARVRLGRRATPQTTCPETCLTGERCHGRRCVPTYHLVNTFGRKGSGADQLLRPSGLALAADGSFLVADRGNSRVQRFSHYGVFQATIGSIGGEPLPPVHRRRRG